MGDGVEFRLLGSLEIEAGGELIHAGGRREQIVLAVLLLEAGRTVGVDDLVRTVWGESPPSTARRQVHTVVSWLRRRLDVLPGWGELQTEVNGYRFGVPPARVDALVFEQLVAKGRQLAAEGRMPDAVRAFRDGLGLWRGPVLAGLNEPLDARALRLTEMRLSALEDCLECEVAHGAGPAAIAELLELAGRHPFRERFTVALMRALTQAGRRGDALEAYHRTARLLADDLGVDPGPALTAQFTATLREPRAQPPAAQPKAAQLKAAQLKAQPKGAQPKANPPRQLPAHAAGFAGRAEALARLDHMKAGSQGVMPIVAISGPGGVGKTTLAIHWAHRVRGEFPDGELYVNLRGFDPVAAPTTPFDVLRDFLVALGAPVENLPDGLQGRVDLYRTLLADRRVLIVLDNARDAGQVRPLLPGSGDCLVVVTSRNRLAGLVAAEGAHAMTVDVLSTAEARELLVQRLGAERLAARPAVTDQMIAGCAGLPLALSIVAARLATSPHLSVAAVAAELSDTRQRLDPFTGDDVATDLRAVLSWSYQTLDAEAARLFRLMGLLQLGSGTPLTAAAELAGLTPARTRPLLAQLVRVHLLAEHADGRYRFHDLVSTYAAELAEEVDTAGDRDAALGRLLDHYMSTAYAAARALQPFIPDSGVLPEEPAAFAGYDSALAWLTAERVALISAVGRAKDSPFRARAWQIAVLLRDFLSSRGEWTALDEVQQVALEAAELAAEPAAQAAAHRGLAQSTMLLGHPEQAQQHLHRSLRLYREAGDTVSEAYCLHNMGVVCHAQGRREEALRHAQHAVDIFQRENAARGEAIALNAIGNIFTSIGDYAQAVEYGRRALAVHRRLGALPQESSMLDTIAYACLQLGQFRLARDHYRQGLEWSRKVGNRHHEAIMLAGLADAHHALDERALARDLWRQALEIVESFGPPPSGAPVRDALRNLPDAASLREKIR